MAEICVALLTPFTTSGDVAFDALEVHTELLIAEGVTSLMPSGTTGEGILFCGLEEARTLWGAGELADVEQRVRFAGARGVVIRPGERGAFINGAMCCSGASRPSVPSPGISLPLAGTGDWENAPAVACCSAASHRRGCR